MRSWGYVLWHQWLSTTAVDFRRISTPMVPLSHLRVVSPADLAGGNGHGSALHGPSSPAVKRAGTLEYWKRGLTRLRSSRHRNLVNCSHSALPITRDNLDTMNTPTPKFEISPGEEAEESYELVSHSSLADERVQLIIQAVEQQVHWESGLKGQLYQQGVLPRGGNEQLRLSLEAEFVSSELRAWLIDVAQALA